LRLEPCSDLPHKMPLTMQRELTGVPRSTMYRRPDAAPRRECIVEEDGELRALVDEYTSRPFYGGRRMVASGCSL